MTVIARARARNRKGLALRSRACSLAAGPLGLERAWAERRSSGVKDLQQQQQQGVDQRLPLVASSREKESHEVELGDSEAIDIYRTACILFSFLPLPFPAFLPRLAPS